MVGETESSVARHYGVTGLGQKILDAIGRSGLDPDNLNPVDLAPVDEFHMGGRAATAHVLGQMDLPAGARVLDVGSGLGGVTRYLAAECGCRATGIDLTPEFVQVAEMLTERTRLSDNADFRVGSALDLPWPAQSFDAAVTFHVAMNIEDRPRLYAEVGRVLRPGGQFAIYDVMKGPTDGMLFPVPWSESAETSFLVTPDAMTGLLDQAGFEIVYEEDRRDAAVEHHRKRLANLAAAGGPPPLGVHLLTGETTAEKSRNMLQMLEADQIALGVIIARRKG
jgi:ubiquinone/menaquinone biosynthesis C-methylase UbiE